MKKKKLSIGFSPCPNDTFIFYALVHGKLSGNDFLFEQRLEDVETLNTMALRSALDITKVSYHAFGYIREDYRLLRPGGAMGRGCGPLLVARETSDADALIGKRIAVPGRYTTAFLLLQLYNPLFRENIIFMPFHTIMDAVKNGDADAGLIIHESRFTYPLYGLRSVLDLGYWWEKETSLPIPLGAVVAKKSLGGDTIKKIELLIKSSVAYAFAHREKTLPYIKAHSRELSDDVIGRHVDLYVNKFSLDPEDTGEKAVRMLLSMAEERGIFPGIDAPLHC